MSHERILAKVARDEFVGRDAELRQLVEHAAQQNPGRALVLTAPNAGASEFLRQAYDELFFRRDVAVPIHFAFDRKPRTRSEIAAHFFVAFLQQYIAYRRVDPSLCVRPTSLYELADLALPTDYEAVSSLIEAFERERPAADEKSFLRFCLTAPSKLAAETKRSILPVLDCVALSSDNDESAIVQEIAGAYLQRDNPVVLAGLRRHVLNLVHAAGADLDHPEMIRVDLLPEQEAERLIDALVQRFEIESNEQTRDLIVQQLGGSTFFISALLQGARERRSSLTSFLDCQRLYVDELMGGRIHRHFSGLLEQISPHPHTRRTLLRVLYESSLGETRKSSVWTWKKRLGVETSEFEQIIEALHVYELANASGAMIELNTDSVVWMDYLRAHYQIEVAGQARALSIANLVLETLKRAPHAMARKYRREAAVGLDELLARFNCQEVPALLLDAARFAADYSGEDVDAINESLDASSAELLRLPQIVQVTDAKALATSVITEDKRCVAAHAFEAAEYTDENEVVWIAAEVDSKLPANEDVTKEWCNRLTQIARECEFKRVRLWLVSREGFSPEASEILKERNAYSSSHRQFELLTARLQPDAKTLAEAIADEYEMVIPMSTDTELIAANTVEQIARRINFAPEAINQIKLALVEACINAAEHSLSPDRKIYQRFRVENDKLVVTVTSRGVVPANVAGPNGTTSSDGKNRRGWGLKLIKTLMDEVEFERVDDGTQLRMTKFRK
jgi:serine/threonine-protein kinase RsbW